MDKISSLIRQFRENEDGSLTLKRYLLESAIKDLEAHGGHLGPGELWDIAALLPAYAEKQANPTFDDMLQLWIGDIAMHEVSADVLRSYRPFLKECDFIELLPAFLNAEIAAEYTRRIADLGTIIDVNMIIKHLQHTEGDHLYFLELGGGYGRLAEAFLGIFEHQVKYVMVDAVPESLVYTYLYLSKNFPNRRIGFYYSGDDFDLERYDCYIVPAWRFEELNRHLYDVAINIASMQEMEQDQIDYYVSLFNRVTKLGGEIYISNSRDYHQKEFNYPKHWRLVYKRNTPKSMTPNYPIEIFIKLDRDCSEENACMEAEYIKELCKAYQREYWPRVRQLAEQRRAAQAKIRQLAEQKRAAQAKIRQLTEQKGTAQAKIRQLAEQKRAAQAKIRQLAEQKRAAQAKIRQLTEQKGAAQTKIRQLAEQRRAAQTKIKLVQENARRIAEEKRCNRTEHKRKYIF